MSLDPQDTKALALARLIQAFKGQPNVASVLNAINGQTQAVEDALQQLLTLRALSVATGDQLDQIGEKVGLARQGVADDEYRKRLQGWIKVNKSGGTVPQLLEIFALMLAPATVAGPDGTPVLVLTDEPPAAFTLLINVLLTDAEIAFLLATIRRARAAGVGGRIEVNGNDFQDRFFFDGAGPGLDVGYFSTNMQ